MALHAKLSLGIEAPRGKQQGYMTSVRGRSDRKEGNVHLACAVHNVPGTQA